MFAQHHRMVHSGGVNRSADARWVPEGPQIRMVVPCDFQKEGLTYLESETSNPGPNHQWWVNTRQVRLHNCAAQIFCASSSLMARGFAQFAEDTLPTAENMWENWAI